MDHTLLHPNLPLELIASCAHGAPLLSVRFREPCPLRGTIAIDFPEHIWGRRRSTGSIDRLCVGHLGETVLDPAPLPWHGPWERMDATSVAYRWESSPGFIVRAHASCFPHGIRLGYSFSNQTGHDYEEVQPVTCIQLRDELADPRLERCAVHHSDGWDLLASESPHRLTVPLDAWLPCRYLVSFRWPPGPPCDLRDGITYYNKPAAWTRVSSPPLSPMAIGSLPPALGRLEISGPIPSAHVITQIHPAHLRKAVRPMLT